MDRPFRYFVETTPFLIGIMNSRAAADRGYPYDLFDHPSFQIPAKVYQGKGLYRGRIAILVDMFSASASEDFVVPFKNNGRAVVIGETTGGSSGEPYSFFFPTGMNFGIGTKRLRFPDGSLFEGVGIKPNIEVPPTIADMRAGRDAALERAIAWAKSE